MLMLARVVRYNQPDYLLFIFSVQDRPLYCQCVRVTMPSHWNQTLQNLTLHSNIVANGKSTCNAITFNVIMFNPIVEW